MNQKSKYHTVVTATLDLRLPSRDYLRWQTTLSMPPLKLMGPALPIVPVQFYISHFSLSRTCVVKRHVSRLDRYPHARFVPPSKVVEPYHVFVHSINEAYAILGNDFLTYRSSHPGFSGFIQSGRRLVA